MARVAVTGIGTINSIAGETKSFATALQEMRVGTGRITRFDPVDYPVKIAAEVKDFDPKVHLGKKLAKRYDRFLQFALVAAREAMLDSGLDLQGDWRDQAAVTVSSGIGGVTTLQREYDVFCQYGPRFISPFLIPMLIPNMVSGIISMEFGLRGPNFATVSACASSLHSLIVSTMMIKHGYAQVAVTGGSEAIVEKIPVAGFANMLALSRNNDNPQVASRPFSPDRDGFVIGEGAGIIVLESEEFAKHRKARIYGFIDGFGMSGDAYDFSASAPDGEGATAAMSAALKMADIAPGNVDLINCHATGTPLGDISEAKAIRNIFGPRTTDTYVQATKSLIGHTIGAAGAIELIASILQGEIGFIHGVPNLDRTDPECIDLNIPTATVTACPRTIVKNAFGFGGQNASVVYECA